MVIQIELGNRNTHINKIYHTMVVFLIGNLVKLQKKYSVIVVGVGLYWVSYFAILV